MNYIERYVFERLKNRTAGIFGTGRMACMAEKLLDDIGIDKYVYIDNDVKKVNNDNILSPSVIGKDYFVLISTVHFPSIKRQLELIGMKELEDYIWVLELDYYNALIMHKNAPGIPDLTFCDLDDLEKDLARYADVVSADWFEESDFKRYEEGLGFQEEYDKEYNPRYRRKILEYYCVDKLMAFDKWNKEQDVYVDVGACGSPFAKYLREKKGIMAYAVDLSEGKYRDIPYYIKEDATKMHFTDGALRGISAQSAFEMFAGTSDIDFVKEVSRCLKQDGIAVICPLYLHKYYLSVVSPNYYHTGTADEDSFECIRTDCRGGIPMARFYDIESLNKRILVTARQCGLKTIIYSLPQEIVEKDGAIYLKFILCLKKG